MKSENFSHVERLNQEFLALENSTRAVDRTVRKYPGFGAAVLAEHSKGGSLAK